MAFTQEQESQIVRQLSYLSQSERQRRTQDQQTALQWLGGFLGVSAVNYVLQKHGWPAVERALINLLRGL